jgi:hypothetical protein
VAVDCEADRQSDPKNCGSCGQACPYPRCAGGICTPTAVAPTQEQIEAIASPIEFSAIYLQRLLQVNSGIAGVGIDSDDLGAKFQLFIAADDDRKPGAILDVKEVEVKRSSTPAKDGLRRGTEWIFPEPLRFPEDRRAFWIGVAAVGGSAGVNVAQFRANTGVIALVSGAASVPAPGQRFQDTDLRAPPPDVPSPHIYVVFYP